MKISSRFIAQLERRVQISKTLWRSISELKLRVKEIYQHYYKLKKDCIVIMRVMVNGFGSLTS